MPMDRRRYPQNWKVISEHVRLVRAKNYCEECGAKNGRPHPDTGAIVVLTVHHLGVPWPDGTPGDPDNKRDCRPENLKVLCQRCHLNAERLIRKNKKRVSNGNMG